MPIKINDHDYWRIEDSFYYGFFITHGYTNRSYSEEKHSQAFYEINLITSGSGTHHFGERTYPASLGDVFIIPPGILHGYDGGEGFDVYHLLLSPDFMRKNFTSLMRLNAFSTIFHIEPILRERVSDALHLKLDKEEFQSVMEFLSRMEAIDQSNTVSDAILSEAFATVILTILCESYTKQKSIRTSSDNDDNFISTLSYIFNHYKESISLDTLVKMAKMSRTSYIERFKRTTGMNPGEFIADCRVQMAKQFLADTQKSLVEIAADIGCYDVSHFVRLFKRLTGKTPTDFRKDLKQPDSIK